MISVLTGSDAVVALANRSSTGGNEKWYAQFQRLQLSMVSIEQRLSCRAGINHWQLLTTL